MPKPRTTKSRPKPMQPKRSATRSRKAAPASKSSRSTSGPRAPAKPAKRPPSTHTSRDPVIVAITLALEEEARQEARAVDLVSQPSAWTAFARQRGVRTR